MVPLAEHACCIVLVQRRVVGVWDRDRHAWAPTASLLLHTPPVPATHGPERHVRSFSARALTTHLEGHGRGVGHLHIHRRQLAHHPRRAAGRRPAGRLGRAAQRSLAPRGERVVQERAAGCGGGGRWVGARSVGAPWWRRRHGVGWAGGSCKQGPLAENQREERGKGQTHACALGLVGVEGRRVAGGGPYNVE
jgi:hypothetical protein